MQTRVVAGIEAGLAHQRLGLFFFAVRSNYACANGAAVGLGSNQLDFEPVITALHVIAKERRRLVHVDDQDVEIAVVIEVPEGAATAAVRGGDTWAGFFDQLFEGSVAKISEQGAGAFVWILRKRFLNLRV